MKKQIKTFLFSLIMMALMMLFFAFGASADTPTDSGYVWPMSGYNFSRGWVGGHKALDIAAPVGANVYAAREGTVYCASTADPSPTSWCNTCGTGQAGYHIAIRHPDGGVTHYAHLSAVNTSVGANVSTGQLIGKVGETGNAQGAHLHFSLFSSYPITSYNAIDPMHNLSPFNNVYVEYTSDNKVVNIKGSFGALAFPMSTAGFYIGTDKNNLVKVTETLNTSGYTPSGVPIDGLVYNTSKWYKALDEGKTYYYKLFITYNGIEYSSSVRSFTTKGGHTHSYGGWTTSKAATCTEAGSKYRSCSCGAKETASITKLGHSLVTINGKPASCKSSGITDSTYCSRCDYVQTEANIIPKFDHSFSNWQTVKPATCTEDGSTSRRCSSCGTTETETINKTGHLYLTIPGKPATCNADGYTDYVYCASCDEINKQVEPILALGHKWSDWITSIEPTKSSTGKAERKCSACSVTEEKTLPKLPEDGHAHSFGEWMVTTAAGCDTAGVESRKCSVCSVEETKSISPKGHKHSKPEIVVYPTEEKEGTVISVCENCGDSKVSVIDKLEAGTELEPEASLEKTASETDVVEEEEFEEEPKKSDSNLLIIILSIVSLVLLAGLAVVCFRVNRKR